MHSASIALVAMLAISLSLYCILNLQSRDNQRKLLPNVQNSEPKAQVSTIYLKTISPTDCIALKTNHPTNNFAQYAKTIRSIDYRTTIRPTNYFAQCKNYLNAICPTDYRTTIRPTDYFAQCKNYLNAIGPTDYSTTIRPTDYFAQCKNYLNAIRPTDYRTTIRPTDYFAQ
eukprot:gene34482-46269_t